IQGIKFPPIQGMNRRPPQRTVPDAKQQDIPTPASDINQPSMLETRSDTGKEQQGAAADDNQTSNSLNDALRDLQNLNTPPPEKTQAPQDVQPPSQDTPAPYSGASKIQLPPIISPIQLPKGR
ncbi:hypothetical protein KA005_24610, partial [bacterium]|nr:hypothetical protein [bacterium]